MNFEPLYETWAPPESRWSPWVKPVLFAADAPAAMNDSSGITFSRDAVWLPKIDMRTALVIDCPGDQSIALGVAAARVGFRPVPLFNACHGRNEVVSQLPLFAVIENATRELRAAPLSPDAPPAFLLDSRRLRPSRTPSPGDFDNRSMVFPQDFPSANLLLASGIETVVVVQPTGAVVQQDLAQVLSRWHKAGLTLRTIDSGAHATGVPQELTVPKPPWYGWLWAGLLVGVGLRMHGAGGFGGIVPQPSTSSG